MDALGKVETQNETLILAAKGWAGSDDPKFLEYLDHRFPMGPGWHPQPWREPLEACAEAFGGKVVGMKPPHKSEPGVIY